MKKFKSVKGNLNTKTIRLKLVLLVILGGLLATGLCGCAFGNRIAYTGMLARFDVSGTNSVAVSAHDQRQLITSGRENPTLVGEMRSLAHIPYGVKTASGQPLATDITSVLATSLSARGFKAVPVIVSHADSPEAVVQRVKACKADRCVVLKIGEWRTDTYFKTELFFDLALNVLDRNGGSLAERHVKGHEEQLRVAPSEAMRQKIEELMNYPDVVHAFSEN